MDGVKGRRRYDSSRRREQAEQTRLAVLEAARALLLDRGFPGTSISMVAAEAHVSPHTIYKSFGDKPALVKAVLDYAIAGDLAPEPIPQRERAQRIFAEPDPRRKIELYARGLMETLGRSARLHLLARGAAETDASMSAVWEQLQNERLAGMTRLADHLAEGGHLAPSVTAAEARDVLWAYTSPELYQLLVLTRGWPAERYRAWIVTALVSALL